MDKQQAQKNFENERKFGVSKPQSFGYEVLENKHGIDDPVNDLNVRTKGADAHFFTTDGKGVTVVDGLVTLVTSTSTSSSTVSTTSSSSS